MLIYFIHSRTYHIQLMWINPVSLKFNLYDGVVAVSLHLMIITGTLIVI